MGWAIRIDEGPGQAKGIILRFSSIVWDYGLRDRKDTSICLYVSFDKSLFIHTYCVPSTVI